MPAFEPFKKIARYSREVIVTEKIDGTNACICIDRDMILAGSRNRWITPEADNFGFAQWVEDNAEQLRELGDGRHFGEWWGYGIQRGYGLKEKRFSLFNVERWFGEAPACCDVVPVLWRGPFDELDAEYIVNHLREFGSAAVPGFHKPEGIVVHHVSGVSFKKTLGEDFQPKGLG